MVWLLILMWLYIPFSWCVRKKTIYLKMLLPVIFFFRRQTTLMNPPTKGYTWIINRFSIILPQWRQWPSYQLSKLVQHDHYHTWAMGEECKTEWRTTGFGKGRSLADHKGGSRYLSFWMDAWCSNEISLSKQAGCRSSYTVCLIMARVRRRELFKVFQGLELILGLSAAWITIVLKTEDNDRQVS